MIWYDYLLTRDGAYVPFPKDYIQQQVGITRERALEWAQIVHEDDPDATVRLYEIPKGSMQIYHNGVECLDGNCGR